MTLRTAEGNAWLTAEFEASPALPARDLKEFIAHARANQGKLTFGTIGAGLQTIVGGNITLLTELCEKTREHAFELMIQHATQMGANAVIGARYDATEVMSGVTEVLCYGTAVIVEENRV